MLSKYSKITLSFLAVFLFTYGFNICKYLYPQAFGDCEDILTKNAIIGFTDLRYSIYAIILALVEFLLHYHIDWAKMSLNRKMGWGATTHNEFWVLLGVDQLLHQLTYILLIFAAVNVTL